MIAYYINLVNRNRELSSKKVLILGFGREGQNTLLFLQKLFPTKTFGIADKEKNLKSLTLNFKSLHKKRITLHLGKRYLQSIRRYDIIIKSPGISPKIVAPFVGRRQKVISQTEFFFDNCSGKIVGITGTKGKSTTSSMIYHILKKVGFKTHLLGNIGKPALSALLRAKSDDIFVYELSSHQLYNLKKSPHIAVFLNIYPEHLDYYRSFKEYARAKANICLWQTKNDYLVYNAGDRLVAGFAKKSEAHKIPIRGKYYELDKIAAFRVAKIFGIERKRAEIALESFKFLPHRLERVGIFRGITFYNDSLSTIPQAAIEAINFLGNDVETLIAGGFDRGVDFKKLAHKILQSRIKTLILFPPSGQRILKAFGRIEDLPRRISFFDVKDMKKAVDLCFKHTRKGKICLLSPASPSFGIFKDYAERGNAFKKNVKSAAK